eukprot:5451773-Pyramimonas_sp.AAC.1
MHLRSHPPSSGARWALSGADGEGARSVKVKMKFSGVGLGLQAGAHEASKSTSNSPDGGRQHEKRCKPTGPLQSDALGPAEAALEHTARSERFGPGMPAALRGGHAKVVHVPEIIALLDLSHRTPELFPFPFDPRHLK